MVLVHLYWYKLVGHSAPALPADPAVVAVVDKAMDAGVDAAVDAAVATGDAAAAEDVADIAAEVVEEVVEEVVVDAIRRKVKETCIRKVCFKTQNPSLSTIKWRLMHTFF